MPARTFLFKILLLATLVFIFLFTPKSAFAQWTKYSGNPVFSGTPGEWDAIDVANSSLIYDGMIYKMWYVGHDSSIWQIGYAESQNGIDDWQKNSQPVIKPDSTAGWDNKKEMEVAHPSVLYTDGKGYEMWYAVISYKWQEGSDRFRLRYAISSDGNAWNIYPEYVLKGTDGSWDSGGMSRGISVIHTGEGYKMWYTGVDNLNNWGIGYATSTDGLHWNKYPNNENPTPVITPTKWWEKNWLSYPNVFYDGQTYHMWYTATKENTADSVIYAFSSDGIHWEKPENQNPVLTLGPSGSFDGVFIVSPFVLKQGNIYKMWYSGAGPQGWKIGYAENIIPTPTPTPLQYLILLPGLGASWNHEAMILDAQKLPEDWYMTPGVKSYDGIIQTFQNAGYVLGTNFFVFNYDWRKPVDEIANDLKEFLSRHPPPAGTKIDLVGHSLGGLIARAYVQENPDNQVDQLLTLGTPHKGAVKAYYIWEGAELSRGLSGWQRIGAGILLQLKKKNFENNVETIHYIVPSLKDILPTFPYLKRNNVEKPLSDMKEKNEWLENLNSLPLSPSLLSVLNTIVGLKGNTLRWINIQERNKLDQLLGKWEDGKPVSEKNAMGDDSVLDFSASLDNAANVINLPDLNHGDLVETIAGQQAIINLLGISPSEIIPAPEITYEPSLVFEIASSAKITVFDPNQLIAEKQKLVFVPNPIPGNYRVEVNQENSGGHYRLLTGKLSSSGDIWTEEEGETKPGESQTHIIKYDLNPIQNRLELAILAKEKLNQAKEKAKILKRPFKILLVRVIEIRIKEIDKIISLLNKGRANQAQTKTREAIFSISILEKSFKFWVKFYRMTPETEEQFRVLFRQAKDYLVQSYELK